VDHLPGSNPLDRGQQFRLQNLITAHLVLGNFHDNHTERQLP